MKLYKALLATAATAVVMTLTLSAPLHADDSATSLPGTTCKPANLDQAFDLYWTHHRTGNPLTNTFQRWVVCPLPYSYDGKSGGWYVQQGVATFHEGPGEIWCIARLYRAETTIDSDPFNQFQSNIDYRSIKISEPFGPYPKGKYTPFDDFFKEDISKLGGFRSMTCRLDPGTGITGLFGGSRLASPSSP